MAEQYFLFGQQDGSNEEDRHEALRYEPVNPAFNPGLRGVQRLRDPNRWQPIDINDYVRKKGIDQTLPDWNWLFVTDQAVFTTPEWGDVIPFSMTEKDMVVKGEKENGMCIWTQDHLRCSLQAGAIVHQKNTNGVLCSMPFGRVCWIRPIRSQLIFLQVRWVRQNNFQKLERIREVLQCY